MNRRKRIQHLALFIIIGLGFLVLIGFLFVQLLQASFFPGRPVIPDYIIFLGLCLVIVIPMLLAIFLKGDDDSSR